MGLGEGCEVWKRVEPRSPPAERYVPRFLISLTLPVYRYADTQANYLPEFPSASLSSIDVARYASFLRLAE